MLTEKDYCDYETCVALKELGYVGICDAYYELTGNDSYNRDSFELLYTRDFIHPDDKDRVAAPLLYQAQKWLRKEKKIEVNATYDNIVELHWHWYMKSLTNRNQTISNTNYDSYEQALLAGIKEAVKILKNGIPSKR